MLWRRSAQFHQDDPYIVHHGKKHLAEVLSLLFGLGGKSDFAYLAEGLHKPGNLRPEVILDYLAGSQRVFDDVMEKTDCDACNIELQVRENEGLLQGDESGRAHPTCVPAPCAPSQRRCMHVLADRNRRLDGTTRFDP